MHGCVFFCTHGRSLSGSQMFGISLKLSVRVRVLTLSICIRQWATSVVTCCQRLTSTTGILSHIPTGMFRIYYSRRLLDTENKNNKKTYRSPVFPWGYHVTVTPIGRKESNAVTLDLITINSGFSRHHVTRLLHKYSSLRFNLPMHTTQIFFFSFSCFIPACSKKNKHYLNCSSFFMSKTHEKIPIRRQHPFPPSERIHWTAWGNIFKYLKPLYRLNNYQEAYD